MVMFQKGVLALNLEMGKHSCALFLIHMLYEGTLAWVAAMCSTHLFLVGVSTV